MPFPPPPRSRSWYGFVRMIDGLPSPKPRRATLLAVDDMPANLLAITALVSSLDVDVVTAESGHAALALSADHHDFAVILLDVAMPGLDGFETLERLRQLPGTAHTPGHLPDCERPYPSGHGARVRPGRRRLPGQAHRPDFLRAKVRVFVALHAQAHAIGVQSEALRAKDRYIGILAHDLRTPLAVIQVAAARQRARKEPRASASSEQPRGWSC